MRRPDAFCGTSFSSPQSQRIKRLHFQELEPRLPLTTLPTGFTETLVASGLSSPSAMDFSPVGELWIVEQAGDVKLIRANGTTHTALDLAVFPPGGTERGLLGIAFHPTYDGAGPNTDYVYLYYTEPAGPAGDDENNRVSRFTVTGAGTDTPTLGSELIVRDLPPEDEDGSTNHNGGAIHFGPDGKLYVAVGDHNYDNQTQANHVAQINTTPFGKILRLNADGNGSDGTNPSDNPFYTGSATDWEGSIWAKGLRNPYTFAFDPETGRMFINDVGEGSWEEINLGEAAANYGWASSGPLWEGFENDATPPPFPNYRDPLMAYDHIGGGVTPQAAVAITGGAFYPHNGPFGGNYGGLYFYADYGAGFIRIFDPDNPGSIGTPDTSVGFATDPSTFGPVDLKVDAAGNLYWLAIGGAVYRISFTGSFGPSQVVARQLFYNNSQFDGNDAEANEGDDGAIATDKTAYLPGDGTIGTASISSYTRGINGVMVDVAGNHGPLSLADFTLRIGANNSPATWSPAPAPLDFIVRGGEGESGSDRVEIVWADGAIRNQYLQVIVEGNDAAGGFNTNTGLAASDAHYWGSRVADSLTGTTATAFATSTSDAAQVFANLSGGVAISNLRDYDRSGAVSTSDAASVFANLGTLTRINISGPAAPEGGGAGLAAVVSGLAATDEPEVSAAPVERIEGRGGESNLRSLAPELQSPAAIALIADLEISTPDDGDEANWLDVLAAELARR